MGLTVGDIIHDKYRIIRMIGEGGMGAVYEGENTLIARRVAIKVLHGSAAVNPDIVQRFQREAQAAGRIGNDHILDVLDLGTLPDGDLFMVMEYLDGENLADRIDRLGRVAPAQLYPLIRQMLEGLDAAHTAGIIHRDLKPENVFILREKAGQKDYVKIIDFGISKFNVMDGGNMGMTATGAVMGTPYYMAPEVAKGVKGADHRSDIYAVGVILYKAITGDEPFSAETFNELLFKIVLSDLVPARQVVPELDPAFDTIISKAMAKEPDHRFPSCKAMIQALDSWAQTGAAVTVPPPEPDDPRLRAGLGGGTPGSATSSGAYGAVQPGYRQSDPGVMAPPGLGNQTPGAQTPGSWANQSTAAAVVPKKSLGPALAAVGALGLLLVVGGAVALYSLLGSGTDQEGTSESAAANEPAAVEPPADEVGDPTAREPTAAPSVTPAADHDTPSQDAGAEPAATAESDSPEATAEKPARPVVGTPRPPPRPFPPRPTGTSTNPPGPARTSGSPDFGY